MKRNDLQKMGLTPDQIDTIMTMNGADINREKAKAGQQTDKEVQPACTADRSAGSRRRASSEGKDNLHPRAGKRRTGCAGCLARDVSGGKGT